MTHKKYLSLCCALLALAAPAAFAQSTLWWSGGTTNITDGTALATNWANMNGTWGTTIKNFATDTNGTTYSAWVNGSAMRVFSSGYSTNTSPAQDITNTMVTSMVVGSITWQVDAPATNNAWGNKRLYINSSNDLTLTLSNSAGTSPVIDVRTVGLYAGGNDNIGILINQSTNPNARVQLAGSNGFTKTGNLYLRIQQTNDGLTGTVNVLHNATSIDQGSAGALQIGVGGSTAAASTLAGVTRFNISAVGLGTGSATSAGVRSRLNVLTGTNNANQLSDSAIISLAGLGQFEYQGRSNYTETISQLRLAASGLLNLSTTANGSAIGALVFSGGIDRATNSLSPNSRAQLLVFANTTTGETTSTVNLGSSHGLGTALLPWATDSRARFFKVDSNNFLVTNSSTDVTDASLVTSSSTDYRITGTNASTFASGAQANSLGFYKGLNTNLAPIITIADTLTIVSGGLAFANDAGRTDTTITGGSITTSNNAPLYISTGSSSAGGAIIISSSITGNIDVAITGNSALEFRGGTANTYSNTTYVNGGTLTLFKTAGINAVGSNVVVRNGAILAMSQNNQIPDGATVTVENGGFWNRGGSSETIASLAGGGMLTANTNSTAITTITNSVTVGDSGIGTLIVSSASNAGITNALVMSSGAVFNMELSASGGTSDQMRFWNFSTNEFVRNNNAINLTLSGTQTNGRYTVSLFKFFSDAGTNLTSSFITNGLTIGTTGTIIGTPTLNYNTGGSAIDLTYNVGAMFYTNGTTYTVTAAENYDAATYIRNGTTLNANVAGVLPTNTPTALVMDDTGSGSSVLNLGANQTVASLSGAVTSYIGLGGNTLTVNGTSSSSFAGTISGGGGSLAKSGTGTLTLTAANTYSGTTTVSAGTLAVNGSIASSTTTVTNTGVLSGSGSVAGTTTIAAGGTISPGYSVGTLSATNMEFGTNGSYNWQVYNATGTKGATNGYDWINGAGTLSISANATDKFNINLWTLSGLGPDTNGNAINFDSAGTNQWTLGTWASISGFDTNYFRITTAATNGTGGFANAFSGTFSLTSSNNSIFLNYAAAAGTPIYSAASGTWTNFTPALYQGAAEWIFDGATGGLATNAISSASVNTLGTLTFSNTAGSYTLSAASGSAGFDSASALAITGNIVNNSASAQTINLALGFSNAATINAVAGHMTFGGAISNGTSLTFTGASNNTVSGAISGAGYLVKDGAGTLVLSGNNTYTGGTLVSTGTLQVGAGGTSGSLSTSDLTNNATLAYNRSDSLTASYAISGTGALIKDGAGTLTLSGVNSYTGTTTISNGAISISVLANAGSNSGIGKNATLTFAGANATNTVLDYTGGNVTTDRTFAFNGTASSGEGGTINMATSTVVTATGSASGTGKMIISEGTLVLSNTTTPNSFAPAAIQVDAGATLALGANNQIGNTTGLILNGGTFLTGTSSAGYSDTLGTLTLSASSTIDLGAWTTGLRTLTFANSSAITWTGTLTITNWQGVAHQSSDVAQILFGTGGLTSTQLGQIYFANQGINGGELIGGGGQLVPIPEPRVYAAAIALLAIVGWRERKHFRSLFRKS